MPREHENQTNQHDHHTKYYIKKNHFSYRFDPFHVRSLGSEADIPPYSPVSALPRHRRTLSSCRDVPLADITQCISASPHIFDPRVRKRAPRLRRAPAITLGARARRRAHRRPVDRRPGPREAHVRGSEMPAPTGCGFRRCPLGAASP